MHAQWLSILLTSLCLWLPWSTFCEGAPSGKQSYDIKELVKMHATLLPTADQKYVAVSLRMQDGWHIYWKNPGDAGLPPQFFWREGEREIPLPALEWPAPQKYVDKAGLLAFGYAGSAHFFFTLTPQAQKELANSTITLQGKWLVCANICIPGEDTLTLNFNADLTALTTTPQYYTVPTGELNRALQQLPGTIPLPPQLALSLARDTQDNLALHFSLPPGLLRPDHGSDHVLTPFPNPLVEFKGEQLYKDSEGKVYGRVPLDWNGVYQNPPIEIPNDNLFRPPLDLQFLFFDPSTGKKEVVSFAIAQLAYDHAGNIPKLYQTLSPFSSSETAAAVPSPATPYRLWHYLLFAFLGGLILNFMPCVLPVVSLKLFSLIKNKGASRGQLLRHNAAYTAGILVSFLGLAAVVALLKSSGEWVGWGFQLQSPWFVATMIVALLLFALNLFGLFEFRLPGGGSWLGSVATSAQDDNWTGDFTSGVLATILSTPCSAPFLGTALTFAFTSSTPLIFLTFGTIGIGLSTPFLLTALFPRSLAILPRPGQWMDDLKKFLGLTLLLTIVWLYDVFVALVGNPGTLLVLNLTLVTLFFAVYFHHHMGQRVWMKLLFYLIPTWLLFSLLTHQGTTPSVATTTTVAGLQWQPWSRQAMQDLKGQPVFINFTAQWCFTCKVNEKLVLNTSAFQQLVQNRGIQLLLGDWTKRDPAIARFLREHGYVGVPAYFVQQPNGTLVPLGETISISEIERTLDPGP